MAEEVKAPIEEVNAPIEAASNDAVSNVEIDGTLTSLSSIEGEEEMAYHLRFHNAIAANDINKLQELLNAKPKDSILDLIFSKKDHNHMNLLHFAVYCGSMEALKNLLGIDKVEPNIFYFDVPLIHFAIIKAGRINYQLFLKIERNLSRYLGFF